MSSFYQKEFFLLKLLFNLAYLTMAHKCTQQQLLAVPGSYENKHRLSESGSLLSACSNASSVEAYLDKIFVTSSFC